MTTHLSPVSRNAYHAREVTVATTARHELILRVAGLAIVETLQNKKKHCKASKKLTASVAMKGAVSSKYALLSYASTVGEII